MQDTPISFERDGFVVSTDRGRLDLDATLALLHATYWGGGMTRDALERAVAHSVSFGLFHHERQIGFARVVSDLATFGYLTDVVVDAAYRGQGLGQWLTRCILAHPELQGFRRLSLLTHDAQDLYARFGFAAGAAELTYMERREIG